MAFKTIPTNKYDYLFGDFPEKYFPVKTLIKRNPDCYPNQNWDDLQYIYIVVGYYKDVNIGWCAQTYNISKNRLETYMFCVVDLEFTEIP